MLARGMLRLLDTRRPRLFLVLFCLLLWTPGFFTLPPGDRDESRFAQATKQMIETGDYVRIMNGDEARNRKPIGIYWLQAPFVLTADALGLARDNPIWPYRIPSAIGGLIAVLATHAVGRRLLGRREALLAACLLAGSLLLITEVHIAKTDAALLGSVTLAMLVMARAYAGTLPGRGAAVLFWLALAASILLKGPIGPMVAGLAVLVLVVADRRARWLLALRPAWGLPLMVAAVLPWFVAIGLATHGAFFADAVGGDLGRKLTSGDDAHGAPPGLHLVLLPVLLLPAAGVVFPALWRVWRDRRAPANRFLLAWLVPAWIVFEATPTKLPHYTLPLYPAICLLVASALLRIDRTAISRWWALVPMVLAAALGVALAAAPIILHLGPWLGLPALVAGLVLAACAWPWWRGRQSAAHCVFAATVAMPLLTWSTLGWELPRLQPLWIAPRVAAVLPPGRLGAVGFAEPSLMFLAGTGTRWLRPEAGAAALAQGAVDTLLVADRNLAAVLADLHARGIEPLHVATIDGFNYSRGRRVTLTLLAKAS